VDKIAGFPLLWLPRRAGQAFQFLQSMDNIAEAICVSKNHSETSLNPHLAFFG
jgi:hypothetical protein